MTHLRWVQENSTQMPSVSGQNQSTTKNQWTTSAGWSAEPCQRLKCSRGGLHNGVPAAGESTSGERDDDWQASEFVCPLLSTYHKSLMRKLRNRQRYAIKHRSIKA